MTIPSTDMVFSGSSFESAYKEPIAIKMTAVAEHPSPLIIEMDSALRGLVWFFASRFLSLFVFFTIIFLRLFVLLLNYMS
jgi:hypothetical protein